MKTESIIINKERNVILDTYILEGMRPGIIILPGGGYHVCADKEGEPVTFPFLKAGFNAFVLKYSVDDQERRPGNNKWPNPLEDFDLAFSLLKNDPEKFNTDPEKIAVIGFSAGGHLALAAATKAKNKPKAAILGYPVTAAEPTHQSEMYVELLSSVTEKTCPCFIFATRDDPSVPVINSIKLMEALYDAGVKFESHIYSHGPHAFSTCDASIEDRDHCPRVENWVGDCVGWLRETLDLTC